MAWRTRGRFGSRNARQLMNRGTECRSCISLDSCLSRLVSSRNWVIAMACFVDLGTRYRCILANSFDSGATRIASPRVNHIHAYTSMKSMASVNEHTETAQSKLSLLCAGFYSTSNLHVPGQKCVSNPLVHVSG